MREYKISEFLDNEFTQSSLYNNYTKLPNVCNNKNTETKLLWYMLNKGQKPDRVSNHAASAISYTQYLHGGPSIEGVLTGMGVNYICSGNNLNILFGDGSYGTRFAHEPGASRYIQISTNPLFNLMYRREDTHILEHQYFEGSQIEPKQMYPVMLPLWSYTYGISVGFASNIAPRNPKNLIKYQKEWLSGKPTNDLLHPYLKGYKGTVTKYIETDSKTNEDKIKYLFRGKYNKKNSTEIEITEVGPFESLEGYLTHLDKLVKDKVIKDYEDLSEHDNFHFILKIVGSGPDSFWTQYNNEEKIAKILKLDEVITENITMFNENNKIVVYKDIEEYTNYFMNWRLQKYGVRKEHQLNQLAEDIKNLMWKRNFITLVVNDQVKINKQSKAEIVSQLTKLDAVLKTGNNPADRELHVSLPIYNLTKEKIEELDKYIVSKETQRVQLEKTTPEQIWLKELDELEKAL